MNFFLPRYYFHALRHPRQKDFISQGLGIEARQQKTDGTWQPHLERCRSLQTRGFSHGIGEDLVVLGAGRLYDFAAESAAAIFSRIEFVDYDPGCVYAWKNFQKSRPHISCKYSLRDITSVLEAWTVRLAGARTLSEIEQVLCSLEASAVWNGVSEAAPRTVLSLNLLSQIPLYWRDRVHEILRTRFHLDSDDDGSLPEKLESAMQESMRRLETAHLEQLQASEAKVLIVIADTHFNYYLDEKGPKRTEAALAPELMDNAGALEIAGYKLLHAENWLWHLMPKGIEDKNYGITHAVSGWVYLKVAEKAHDVLNDFEKC